MSPEKALKIAEEFRKSLQKQITKFEYETKMKVLLSKEAPIGICIDIDLIKDV